MAKRFQGVLNKPLKSKVATNVETPVRLIKVSVGKTKTKLDEDDDLTTEEDQK